MSKDHTFVQLDDIHSADEFMQKLKLVKNENTSYTSNASIPMYIKYNYFHDLWEDLMIDTGFINIKGLYTSEKFAQQKVTIKFDPDHKINKLLTDLLTFINDTYINKMACDTSILQKTPAYYIHFKTHSNCVFLGSKSKNFENVNITSMSQLRQMYYSNITDCRLIIKPRILKIQEQIIVTMRIMRSEFKYSNAHVQSEITKKTNKMVIINDNVDNSNNIKI
jgi:hypothetical protein